jgi:HEAT repeat protein
MRSLMLVLSLLAPAAALAQGSPADTAFYRAFYEETARRDFAAAEKAYAAVAATTGAPADLAAKAHVGRARCLVALGRAEEAQAEFRAALEIDPKNEEAKAGVAANSAGDDEEIVRTRIRTLVFEGLQESNREQAVHDLLLIGPRAVPALRDALHDKNVGTVEGAASVLASLDIPEARAALDAAFGDADVAFPAALVGALPKLPARPASVSVWLAAMNRPESALRERVLGFVPQGQMNTELFAPLLERALRDPSPDVRLRAANLGWGNVPRRAAVDAIVEYAKAKDPRERAAAIGMLAWLEDIAVDALVAATSDPDAQPRRAAIRALVEGRGRYPRLAETTLDACARLIDDPDDEVSRMAVQGLAKNTAEWTPAVARAVSEAARRAIAGERHDRPSTLMLLGFATSDAGKPSPSELLDVLARVYAPSSVLTAYERGAVRGDVCAAMARRTENDPRAHDDFLVRALGVVADDAARAALVASAAENETVAPQFFFTAARDPAPAVRTAAYRAINGNLARGADSSVADPSRLSHLDEDLGSTDALTRSQALAVAYRLPDRSFVPGLRSLFQTADDGEKTQALKALVACAGKDALPEVRAALHSKDGETYFWAAIAVVRIRGVDAADDLVEAAKRKGSAYSALQPFMSSGYGDVLTREVVTRFVGGLDAKRIPAQLLEFLGKYLAPETIRPLVLEALRSPDPADLGYAEEAARSLHVVEAWPQLIALLDHSDESVRTDAKAALRELREYQELRRSLEEFGLGGRADAVRDAKALLKSTDATKRRGAALALGALGDAAAVPALLECLSDPDDKVREAALGALEKLGASGTREGGK